MSEQESAPRTDQPAVNDRKPKEAKLPRENKKQGSALLPSIIIAITAIICTAILSNSIGGHFPNISPPREMMIKDALLWDDVEIEYTWISTDAIRAYSRDGILGGIVDQELGYSETLTFANGMVRNKSDKELEIRSATLMLVEENGVTIGTLTLSKELAVQPGGQRPIELQGWIPSAIVKDVVRLSGRLGYSFD